MTDNRAYVTELAQKANAAGTPVCWAEPFYAQARGNPELIPWADMEPNPNLVQWAQRNAGELTRATRILVSGCGLGDDAAFVAAAGRSVDAFDVAPTAVEWARERFPAGVTFFAADLLELPATTAGAYDLVVEIYTLQVLPAQLRGPALRALAACLNEDGRLLIICRGRDDNEPFGELPWGVSKRDLMPLQAAGLRAISFEDYSDPRSGSRRFRAYYGRAD